MRKEGVLWLSLAVATASSIAAGQSPSCDPVRGLRSCSIRFRQTLLLTGELHELRSEPIVVPRTPSWRVPIRWMEEDGAVVTRGQKILELDNAAFAADLEERRLALRRAASDLQAKHAAGAAALATARFAVEKARIDLEKARLAAAVPVDVLSRHDWEERQIALRRATVADEKARANLVAEETARRADEEVAAIALDKARRQVEAAESAIARLSVRAPSDGVVIVSDHPWEGRKLQVGDTVWVGLTVMRIPDLSSMRVEASLSDVDDGEIAVGMAAVCVLDMLPASRYPATVEEVSPVAQEPEGLSTRRAFRVRLSLAESDPERMRPGMSVRVEVETYHADDAVVAPRAALDLDTAPPRVYLAGGGEREVSVGPCNPQVCVILDGLAPATALARASAPRP